MDTTGEWARGITRVAVLTGAGISTDSGIPDYRGPDGLWTRDPAALDAFTYDRFRRDPEARARFWRTYAEHPAWRAEPNVAHRALVALRDAGTAVRVLTQNVDGLHQRAGLADRTVLELHGTIHRTRCTGCGATTPTPPVLARVRAGEEDPTCGGCGAVLALAVTLFGEYLDGQVLDHARRIAAVSPLLLAVGSSLRVEPAASLCAVAVEAGARLIIVNRDETPYDHLADEVIREPIGSALPRIVAALIAGRDLTPAR
ncbi:SIR2 family NAD-dependent protein deacylase [Micromonospora auratinigra]|uniref:protein acetyllysine N-acetyltransferase n=1 Tax=Micromonospora auratinigra TaxID=261654 RepID=A0A1A8ZC29_9ACTN|nr:Sir2 family NAD-dependent protein deacetylase [Micromonospora auratinigra]SBT41537.1 NAD-dependent deacetylase [Micromonospora auratinigra]